MIRILCVMTTGSAQHPAVRGVIFRSSIGLLQEVHTGGMAVVIECVGV
jgi:hypothetical protein